MRTLCRRNKFAKLMIFFPPPHIKLRSSGSQIVYFNFACFNFHHILLHLSPAQMFEKISFRVKLNWRIDSCRDLALFIHEIHGK